MGGNFIWVSDRIDTRRAILTWAAHALVHIDVAISTFMNETVRPVLIDEVIGAYAICIARLTRTRVRMISD
jgi:hypothetical protein